MLTTFGAGATGVALWLLSPHGAPEIKTETDGIAGAQVVDPEAVSYAVINSEAAVYSTVSNENLQEALAGVPVLLIHEPNGGLRVVVLN